DRPPAGQQAEELRVRVVWLVSGLAREDAVPPPDLGDVLAELTKLGIDKPRLAAQTLVNALPGQSFKVDGSAKLEGTCRLAIAGVRGEKKAPPSMHLDVKATREGEPQKGFAGGRRSEEQICSLSTHITTPLGHAVVLGVTPTDGLTSVFVVQVLRKDAKG